MTITLTADIEKAVVERANERQTAPEAIVLEALREKFWPRPAERKRPFEPRDEWEARLLRVATPCGVSLSDEAFHREGLYD
jgi:hypothetical protein